VIAVEGVSYTAQWTAAARALETERDGDGLFEDRYARALAAPRGFELLEKYRGGGVTDFIAIRTRYMDDSVARVMSQGEIDQIVLVANGMDTRPYRMRWPERATVYELDHSSLLVEKRARMDQLSAIPAVTIVEVGTDLAGDWRTALENGGFTPSQPTLWVAEGLLFFLTEDHAGALLKSMAEASAPGSWLAVDMTSAALLRHPVTQPFLSALRADDTPWQFGTDDPQGFLADHEWVIRDLKQPGQPGAGAGRWPYEVLPDHFRGVPRNWLVNATTAERS
jgi:methyltransferase (TIGR00027 family)